MGKPYLAAILLVLGTLAVGIGVQRWPGTPIFNDASPMQEQAATSAPTGKYMGIEAYVTAFISDLSPKKERLGGAFYVTKIEITGSTTGVVEYEDGHDAYVADFTYATDPATARPEVTSFTIRAAD